MVAFYRNCGLNSLVVEVVVRRVQRLLERGCKYKRLRAGCHRRKSGGNYSLVLVISLLLNVLGFVTLAHTLLNLIYPITR